MVVIRLSRSGAKKAPYYNVVVADSRNSRDGRFIEHLGHYNPEARGKETRLELNKERIDHWIGQGAKPSDRAASLIKAFIKQDEKFVKAAPSRLEQKVAQQKESQEAAKKKLEAEKKAAAEEAKAEAEAAAPAEEKPAEEDKPAE
ncbi:MAG: 30S ribosomal protein S16 [Coxiellaceae bacterium]|nr:30S ribosomal protein S16 [Coxiellaceae bacterium]